MKRLVLITLLIVAFTKLNAQESVLSTMSKNIADMGCFKALFAFTIPADNDMAMSLIGEMTIKGDKYILDLDNMEIYSDGATVWYYTSSRSEVIIENNVLDEGNILSTPASLLSISDRDFKITDKGIAMVGDIQYNSIKVIPRDSIINRSILGIDIIFDKDTLPKSIQVRNSDDSYIDFKINKISKLENLKDSLFIFDITRAKEVIDFR